MAVVAAMSNGTIPLGIFGSYCIYKEKLTILQVSGSLISLAGILTISLSVLGEKSDSGVEVRRTPEQQIALRMMIIDGFMAMVMLGTRINCTKYCTRIISAFGFVKLNFLGDCLCAAFVILLSAL